MSSDSNHPFDLPDPPPSEEARKRALRKALGAFDEKYSSNGQAFPPTTRLMSSTENGSGRSRKGRWMKREHMALAASIAVLVLSPIVVMRSGVLDAQIEQQAATPQPKPTTTPSFDDNSIGKNVGDKPDIQDGLEIQKKAELAVPKPTPKLQGEISRRQDDAIGFRANGRVESEAGPPPPPAAAPLNQKWRDTTQAEAPVRHQPEMARERFDTKPANAFKAVQEEPVSTFSVDVDTASYSFMRSSLSQNRLPQQGAVRTEELVNYFPYDYPRPDKPEEPFRVSASVFPSPWAEGRRIVQIGIKGYAVQPAERPRANLVLLVDVSGSMNEPNKLPLLKQSLAMLATTLDARDTVAIVTYAGQAGTALEPTPISNRRKILDAIENLSSGGSTAGAEGIRQAYALAEQNFDPKGVNRILLATDGDFNVGITNHEELKSYIARKRESGIFLSVLGFGRGNYNDSLMQILAQNGNGVAAYIDTLNEARKVLVEEATSSLIPIAKDVKIQVEFNPATVSEYRLIGYETRLLRREDFNNDKVDAGDVGSGHTVTALYEIVPVGGPRTTDALRYGQAPAPAGTSDEVAFVKLRYKLPKADTSQLMTTPIDGKVSFGEFANAPQEARFATAVAAFGEILRGGQQTGGFSYDDVLRLASAARGEDPFGYRSEFLQLVRAAKTAR
jgi:Ca-activated chloride channel homolog